jgi:hypothetical protein
MYDSHNLAVILTSIHSDFGGLEVECCPLEPKFAGSNPAEALRFFRAKKSSVRLPSEKGSKPVGPMS